MFKNLAFLLITLITVNNSSATIISSNLGGGSGLWSSGAIWDLGVVPGCYDTIQIVAGDQINLTSTVNLNACSPVYLLVAGRLHFPNNGKNLQLPCDSYIEVPIGGSITAPGNDNSNKISICGAFVWTSNQPDINGPATLGVAPLPVELVSFEANVNVDKVDVKWVTASEINNDYFTIEKSTDAKNWKEIIVVSGAGNSNNVNEYFESDYELYNDISYYRLKQTDFNGEFDYSNVVPVKYSKKQTKDKGISLFPNPASKGETVQIEFKNIYESELLVVLRNTKGEEFYSKIVVNVKDALLIGVPIERSIPSGVYLVTASSENQMYSQRLIIK